MTRARDVANVLSTATSLATDTETAAAISSHATAANGHVGRGNTASRPGSPAVGDLYFDTTLDKLIQYTSTGWAQIAPVPNAPTSVSATAGANLNATVSFTAPTNVPVTSYTVTSSPGNITASGASSPITVTGLTDGTSYTFTVTALGSNGSSTASSASNSIIGSQPFSTTYLVIAGGGAGGNAQSGGGGAGGYLTSSTTLSIGVAYSVTVGAGGAVNPSGYTRGGSGANSIFNAVTSTGGGGGGGFDERNGGSGGSGGGGANNTNSVGGSGTGGQGNAGGGVTTYGHPYRAAGGGGASAAGANGYNSSGNGGDGLSSSITGSTVIRAGGGGGGLYAGDNPGLGGAGGGGTGGARSGTVTQNTPINAGSGTINTGGGGGGNDYPFAGAAGGSGVVILRYPSARTITLGAGLTGSTSTVSTDKVTTITAGTGTVTFA